MKKFIAPTFRSDTMGSHTDLTRRRSIVTAGAGISTAGCTSTDGDKPGGTDASEPTTTDLRHTTDGEDHRTEHGTVVIDSYPGDDLGEMWNNALDDRGPAGATFILRPGDYRLSTTVDYTAERTERDWDVLPDGMREYYPGYTGHHVVYLNSNEITITDADVGIDATGCGRMHTQIHGGLFVGETKSPAASEMPRAGILLARPAYPVGEPDAAEGRHPGDCAFWKFYGTQWTGHYEVAGVAAVSAEAAKFYNCRFENNNDGGHTLAWDKENYFGFSTINPDLEVRETPGATTTNRFYGCGFNSRYEDGDGIIHLDGVKSMSFVTGYMRGGSTDESVIVSHGANDLKELSLYNIHHELCGTYIQYENNSGSGTVLRHLTVGANTLDGVNGDFIANDGEDPVTLYRCDMSSIPLGGPAGGIDVERVGESIINLGQINGEKSVRGKLDQNLFIFGRADDFTGEYTEENNIALDPTDGSVRANQLIEKD
jgi:hypothetical protein